MMQPTATLDRETLRANVRAWARFTRTNVSAVVKNDGYGWGAGRIAGAIDDLVDSYFVANADEFDVLRSDTQKPVRLINDVPIDRLDDLLDRGAIVNISDRASLERVDTWARKKNAVARIRVGVVDATSWSSIRPKEIRAFAELAARSRVSIEVWTHITSLDRQNANLRTLGDTLTFFRDSGVDVVSDDYASTGSAHLRRPADRVRIGAGLFGARLGVPLALACAIRLSAPVVRRHVAGEFAWAGYGETAIPSERGVSVVRCGYGDGFPKLLEGSSDIVSVGMQFTTTYTRSDGPHVALVDQSSDLDALAAQADLLPHELVCSLARRAQGESL